VDFASCRNNLNLVKILVSLGKKVRSLRRSQELSQEKLAESADLDRTYISGIERGKRNVSIVNLAKIATALGVTVSKLLRFK
jgi:transcriptional regulator with XRE-family HTH domain